MTGKWALFIDLAKCHNCRNCYVACKDEHVGNAYPGYAAPQPRHGHDWIAISTRERGEAPMVDVAHLPTMCNHCDDPPCAKAARDGAVVKRPDGIVLIVPEKARGQRQIVDACPYGAVTWNEELQLPQAWPFDAHLLDAGWKRTRGAQSCPTQAMRTVCVEDEEMRRLAADQGLEVLHPEHGTRPRVWYRNLDRNWALTADWAERKVEIPALFVAGANDVVLMMTPPSVMDGWVTDLRGTIMVPEAGHWVQQEQPAAVNEALLDFLRTLEHPW